MAQEWYIINNIQEVDSPALVLYLQRIKENIANAVAIAGDAARLRPHVKTHKCAEVTGLLLQAGIRKFKCATIAEAELVARCGARDVLLAYQPVGPKVKRLLQLVTNYPQTQFSCLVDSAEAAQALAHEATQKGLVLPVFIDINIGMNRTGVHPNDAVALYKACREFKQIKVTGLHGYDGHINDTDTNVRRQHANEAYGMLEEAKVALEQEGLTQPVIVVGGSPTFAIHAEREDVECSPGTFVFWDRSYSELFPDLPFVPAALVVSRVVSVVDERIITIDLGHKSVAAENPLQRRVHFLNATGLIPVGQSEEHLVLQTDGSHTFKTGDVLYGMPYHVCPTCALYDTGYVIEDGMMKERWKIAARDRVLTI